MAPGAEFVEVGGDGQRRDAGRVRGRVRAADGRRLLDQRRRRPWGPADEVIAVAHAQGVPVLVDASNTLPPAEHLHRFVDMGADLVAFSGGKGLRGPQGSGILTGRADLIRGRAPAERAASRASAGR